MAPGSLPISREKSAQIGDIEFRLSQECAMGELIYNNSCIPVPEMWIFRNRFLIFLKKKQLES